MAEPINQHYVPQFLLRRFTDAKTGALWTFDKASRRVFSTNPRNVAAERRFYDIEVETGLTATIEPGLAELEEKAARVIDRIVTEESLASITLEDRVVISAFLAAQFTRTRHMREQILHVNREIANWLVEAGLDPEKVEGFGVLTDQAVQYMSMKLVDDSRLEMTPHFFEKIWILLRNRTDQTFLLSDNPVTLHNNAPRGFYGTLGLTSKGVEIYMPLSPKLALNLLCPSFGEQVEEGRRALAARAHAPPEALASVAEALSRVERLVGAVDRGIALDLKPDHVLRVNSLQVRYGERWLFSSRANFGLAEEMLVKHPELARGPRLKRS